MINLLELPIIRDYLDGRILCSVETDELRIALTFDDGPNPRYTPKLLDLLASKQVPATFFLVGKRVRRHPGIARRIAEEGHEIANHGFHHIPVLLLPLPLLEREASGTGRLLEDVTGQKPRFFRPPMGWFHVPGLKRLERMGYRPVIGDVHPRDFARPGVDAIVQFVMTRVIPGSIVILHDGGWREGVDRSQTLAAVDRLIDLLRGRGFGFRTLSGLVGIER